jgi:AcrR family transcriptional regulator
MGTHLATIIETASQVFLRLGIRSVNMDDMAKHLRISKKTLYQHVKDKNDLVERVVESIGQEHNRCISSIQEESLNAIDESYRITEYVAGILQEIHPSVHFDLEKYHPKAWQEMQDFEKRTILGCMTNNIEQGVREGLYRDDLNIPIIVRVYLSRFDVCFDGELFPPSEYSFPEVQWEIFRYHIRGIASEKGLKYLNKKVKRELELS